MWSDGIVVTTPRFNDHLCFEQSVEHFALQQFVAQFAIEALVIAVLPGTARLDIERLNANAAEPTPNRPSRELAAIVRANMIGGSMLDKEIGQGLQDVVGLEAPCNRDREALARVFINDRQHSDRLSIMRASGDEVIGPNVMGPVRPEANAGPIVEPEPASFWLPLRNFEAFASPDPLDPLVVHRPSIGS